MATFHTFCDLITPGTDKEGSAQICRRKKELKKSTLGGHWTTSGRSKRSKAGPCPRSSLSRTAAPHLTDKFEFLPFSIVRQLGGPGGLHLGGGRSS